MASECPALYGRLERVDGDRDSGRLERRDDRLEPPDLLVRRHRSRTRVAGCRAEIDGVCAVGDERERVGDRGLRIGMTAARGKRIFGKVDDSEDPRRGQITPSFASWASSSSVRPSTPLYTASLSAPSAGAPRATSADVREKRG